VVSLTVVQSNGGKYLFLMSNINKTYIAIANNVVIPLKAYVIPRPVGMIGKRFSNLNFTINPCL